MKSALMSANQSEELPETRTLTLTARKLPKTYSTQEFIICHPSSDDVVPFPYMKATQYQAPKARHRFLLGYHRPLFSCTQAIRCYKLHQQNVGDGLAHCTDLKSYWWETWLKWESAVISLMNIALRNLALRPTIDTFAWKHPWCFLLANILTE